MTAPTGAAIRDIIHITQRRNPFVQMILYPALVQGDGAAASIVRGINMLDSQNTDIIIVGRGGGSIEDLWAFNEEAVARAIFNCKTPVISAVGHETDTLISDFVADLRAPTPSAAAELAVYRYADCENRINEYKMRLNQHIERRIQNERGRLGYYDMKLKMLHPRQKLNEKRQLSADLETRLRRKMEEILKERRHRLAIYIEKMKGLSPLQKLNQGYSYVEDSDKKNIRSVAQVETGDILRIYVTDGTIDTQVTGREMCADSGDISKKGGRRWEKIKK